MSKQSISPVILKGLDEAVKETLNSILGDSVAKLVRDYSKQKYGVDWNQPSDKINRVDLTLTELLGSGGLQVIVRSCTDTMAQTLNIRIERDPVNLSDLLTLVAQDFQQRARQPQPAYGFRELETERHSHTY